MESRQRISSYRIKTVSLYYVCVSYSTTVLSFRVHFVVGGLNNNRHTKAKKYFVRYGFENMPIKMIAADHTVL